MFLGWELGLLVVLMLGSVLAFVLGCIVGWESLPGIFSPVGLVLNAFATASSCTTTCFPFLAFAASFIFL